MARRNRLQFPGALYHVMSRGNRKLPIVDDDHDRRTFMSTFSDAADVYQVRVYTVCLMDTHYHALLDTPRDNLSEFVRALNSEHSKSINSRHARVGHTFEQRFHSLVVQREKYLRRVARYIVLNPVKARLCRDAQDWPWSSYRATAGLDAPPSWLYLDWLRWAFRTDDLPEAQRRYQEYVRDPSGLTWSFDLGDALGTVRFKQAVGESREGVGDGRPIPRDCRRRVQPRLEEVFPGEDLDCRRRDALILVAHVTHGYRVAEIARFLRLAPSTVSKALRRATRAQGGVRGCQAVNRERLRSRFTA